MFLIKVRRENVVSFEKEIESFVSILLNYSSIKDVEYIESTFEENITFFIYFKLKEETNIQHLIYIVLDINKMLEDRFSSSFLSCFEEEKEE